MDSAERVIDSRHTEAGERPLLAVLRGARHDPPPVWLMRQAGRYLPEYRALRETKGGFLELCYDSAAAAEVTLQPIHRFGFDGAILFSDILIVPHALGQTLAFEAGEGPWLSPPLVDAALAGLRPDPSRLEPIYGTVRRVAAALPTTTTFLGFAGSPWTVATYMVAGRGSKEQGEARRYAYRDPGGFAAIITAIEEATIDYLSGQIVAGVHAVQLFDSWSGSLAPSEFERWVVTPTARIVAALRMRHPQIPVIGFPKGAGGKLAAYARETGVDALGLDEAVDPAWADAVLPRDLPVQGNLDPLALIAGGDALDAAIDRIRAAFPERPHIFNLGHGHPARHADRACRAAARAPAGGPSMSGWLGDAYLWVKAAHLIFVIFWMAGLFMLPRFYVYHFGAAPGSTEDRLWVDRERRLLRIIVNPAMIAVWVLGLMLAANIGLFEGAPGLGWLHAKLALVFALSGYHGWLAAYRAKLARGERPGTERTLRLMNEVPGIATVVIVVLVIVRPF